ncbi:MarP family serine protease [Nocardia otitidiscaviarum]|uniref:MarP family serine protease n=1 Tax=Nocardia otitidiscaviarum TaxID=1823 RepID=A0A378YDV8_9NOCA|nr:MarP family serine protease [Nocardia otitidiscaviarum]MBF6136220.1 MarP family serine protease [Nocardia otitidiscaviarum]MBF6179080.1 MarP family serine protease [Nocardia otitidiscaviarum]MBF6238270.1 MarP family serine protease [Nocardia otitidiscaviarum]MBF6484002.1 MarP family serine protease [Nocardia otitidiscaviarum]MCP9621620.1 MarP family serine protease [Nocardia otitidiscaviarum]
MSASAWLDLGVLIIALLAASSGWRQGAVASALAFLGVVLGAVAGILIAPHILIHLSEGRSRVLVGVVLIVVLVIIGEVAGMVLGRAARSGMRDPFTRSVDSVVGAGLQTAAVLATAWLLALPLTSSSQPNIAAAVQNSRVLAEVNSVAPDWLRQLPNEFSSLLNTSGLPDVIGPFGQVSVAAVEPPDASVLQLPVAQQLQLSVLRIRGQAPSCQRALEGSGFVVAPERVMTNAHVVAGTNKVSVDTVRGPLSATVVLFDPMKDIAILDVPGLASPVIPLAPEAAAAGESSIVLGYPGGGAYSASAARVRETLDLKGPNIYRDGNVQREVYTVRGLVRAGNSGGPLVDTEGQVLGVVFGAAVTDEDTGYVLTLNEVRGELDNASAFTAPVATGQCVLS